MQRLRTIVALAAILALLPSGSAAVAACFDDGPNRCCCDGDCPDGSLSVSRTMSCCKPAQAPSTQADPPVARPSDGGGAALAGTPLGGTATAASTAFAEPLSTVPRGVRPVPLFRLHAALLI